MTKYSLFFSVVFSVCSIAALAVPATPHPITLTQPDGSEIEVMLLGDENFSYYTNLEGQLLERNKRGALIESSKPLPQRIGSKKQTQIQSTFPKTGKVKSVVLLVAFTDLQFVTAKPQQAFNNLLNQSHYSQNGSTGSAKDYFLASSAGQFEPQFDVYGPYTLPNTMSYYGGNKAQGSYTNHSIRAAEMVKDACAAAEADGVDFSQYDLDNNGVIDNIFIYYAGYNEAEGGPEESIWPHRSYINNSPKYSGKVIRDYACTSELRSNAGEHMCGIGTFCHEFGHVLGLPDMYNTTVNESGDNIYTVGSWDIMCNGSYNNDGRTPPIYTAFERFMLGWLKPEQLSAISNYNLEPLESHNKAYLIAANLFNGEAYNPDPNEYFLIENRQRIQWDSLYNEKIRDAYNDPIYAIPGVGLLITHITYSGRYDANTFNNYIPLGFDIVEPDNRKPSRSSAADTYPGSLNITDWIPTLNNGTILQQQLLSNIYQEDDLTISFHYGLADGVEFAFEPAIMPLFTTSYDKRIIEAQTQTLRITGKGLPSDSVVITLSNSQFDFLIDSEWVQLTTLKDSVSKDNTYDRTFTIRYHPTRQNCATTTTTLRIQDQSGVVFNRINLTGTSPRPTYIKSVKALEATDITPYAFNIRWQPQADAEYYYLTLYTLLDEPNTITQSFEQFAIPDSITAIGWQTENTTPYYTESFDGKNSLLFTEPNSYLITEIYPSAVNHLSFWLTNNFSISDTPTGTLLLEGLDQSQKWETIEAIPILTTTKSITKKYDFSQDQNYIRFRLTNVGQQEAVKPVIDAFAATMNQKPDYIFGKEGQLIYAPDSTFSLSGATPSTTYYYSVRCSENKGCEEHFGASANTISVTTLVGSDKSGRFTVIKTADGGLMAYLPINGNGEKSVAIYDAYGKLVMSIPVQDTVNSIQIPTSLLQPNCIYIAKYTNTNHRINRKEYRAKFLY